jgi:hypothetical protein
LIYRSHVRRFKMTAAGKRIVLVIDRSQQG